MFIVYRRHGDLSIEKCDFYLTEPEDFHRLAKRRWGMNGGVTRF